MKYGIIKLADIDYCCFIEAEYFMEIETRRGTVNPVTFSIFFPNGDLVSNFYYNAYENMKIL